MKKTYQINPDDKSLEKQLIIKQKNLSFTKILIKSSFSVIRNPDKKGSFSGPTKIIYFSEIRVIKKGVITSKLFPVLPKL